VLSHRSAVVFPLIAVLFLISGTAAGQLTPQQTAANLQSFELVWTTVRDRHPDPKLNNLDWQAIHDSMRPAIERARSMTEVRSILTSMLEKLDSSHYAIIPAGEYESGARSGTYNETHRVPAAQPDRPAQSAIPVTNGNKQVEGKKVEPDATRVAEVAPAPSEDAVVRFGNLPEMRVSFNSRTLENGAGYIKFNEFLDPASIMPKFEGALTSFASAPGVILDLRGNPGGIGIMAAGIAGFFIDRSGLKLGEMKTRENTMNFVIFPRPQTYSGPLAILVDGGSASTAEILTQGLQDLKRARVFGVRSAGAALPSDIIRLPNGDGFQFAEASYTSVGGKVIEGSGVTPDVIVRQTIEATRSGRDLVIEAADEWIRSFHR
jgi:carboxyl-terminal processing protease